MSGISSPQNFVDWTWYYIIGAALQRRVWCGPVGQECFPNKYVILVGDPGIGKGLCIRPASEFLSHWKLKDAVSKAEEIQDPQRRAKAIATINNDNLRAQEEEMQPTNRQNNVIESQIIPVAADATTYEALIRAVGKSYRTIEYPLFNKEKNVIESKIYGHSSLCFSLQELSSLLRKRSDDTVNYMLGLFDCPLNYEYDTKTKGKDRVRRGCLNLLAGTTSSFMRSTFDEKLVNEGWTSRTFYIYASKNRFNKFFIPSLSEAQHGYKKDLLDHILALTTLYGHVEVSQETEAFLQDWWNEQENNKDKRKNKSLRLVPYYSRKNIHVMKMAMAFHFSESLELKIPLETFQKAIAFVDREEVNMHYAITFQATNNIARISDKIVEILKHTGKQSFIDLLSSEEIYTIGKRQEVEEALTFLKETEKIGPIEIIEDDVTGDKTAYYSLPK